MVALLRNAFKSGAGARPRLAADCRLPTAERQLDKSIFVLWLWL